jgi:hypothetical protein
MALTGAHAPGATPLTEEDLEGLRIPSVRTHGDLNEAEAANIVRGQEWALRARSDRMPDMLSDRFVPAPPRGNVRRSLDMGGRLSRSRHEHGQQELGSRTETWPRRQRASVCEDFLKVIGRIAAKSASHCPQ